MEEIAIASRKEEVRSRKHLNIVLCLQYNEFFPVVTNNNNNVNNQIFFSYSCYEPESLLVSGIMQFHLNDYSLNRSNLYYPF